MTTETTTNLPPCPLPDCEGGEHHYHEVEVYTAEEDKYHDCATYARNGYRCFGPHQPGLSEPVSLPEVTDEMVERGLAINRVRALHAPISKTVFDGISFVPHDTLTDCGWCDTTYPCLTIQALDGDGDR